MADTDEILFERRGPLGIVTLNRPKALNALNLPMVRAMNPKMVEWATDPTVKALVIRGAGDRAFCSGGDVVAVTEEAKKQNAGLPASDLPQRFFFEEYVLNRRIHRFPKPYIALLDGITMGGGKGLSAHGSHRVVTEKLMFAMPETNIGLFPDVGGGYFLSRCPGETGMYLALSGVRLGAADAMYVGFGTHFVPSASVGALVDALAAADWSHARSREDLSRTADRTIAALAANAGEPTLAGIRDAIDRCFRFDTVPEMLTALDAEASAWGRDTADTIRRMSPTSLAITCRQLREAATLDFDGGLVMEYRMSQGCCAGHDFIEGVRAQLVDKDRAPRWRPATLAEVTPEIVDRHFRAPSVGDLTFGE